jgi:hypothetical protein
MGTTRKPQKGDSMTERNRGVRVLNESYSGFIEKYNPFSELRGVEQVGTVGDEVEIHSWWQDLKRKETWVCVKIDGIQGWMLESETSPRAEE